MKIRNINNMETGPAGLKGPVHPHESADRGLIFRRTVTGLSEEAQIAHAMAAVEEIDRHCDRIANKANFGSGYLGKRGVFVWRSTVLFSRK